MNSEKFLKQTLSAFAVALCSMCMIAGCGKSEQERTPSPNVPAYMKDKDFMKACEEMEKEKRGIMKRFAQARAERDALKEKNPEDPRIKSLENLMNKLEEEHATNQRNIRKFVGEKLRGEKKK